MWGNCVNVFKRLGTVYYPCILFLLYLVHFNKQNIFLNFIGIFGLLFKLSVCPALKLIMGDIQQSSFIELINLKKKRLPQSMPTKDAFVLSQCMLSAYDICSTGSIGALILCMAIGYAREKSSPGTNFYVASNNPGSLSLMKQTKTAILVRFMRTQLDSKLFLCILTVISCHLITLYRLLHCSIYSCGIVTI